jgi:murein peptide amidase A
MNKQDYTIQRGHLALTPIQYGVSHMQQPLHIYLPTESFLPNAPRTLVVAGIHGEEAETTTLLSRALRQLPQEQSIQTAVILCANPDGLVTGCRGNAQGVDLNRNFPCSSWSAEPVYSRWTIHESRSVAYSPGAAPASESEVRALLNVIAQLQIQRIISLHSPLGNIDVDVHLDDSPGSDLGPWLSQATGLPLVQNQGYTVTGTLGQWGIENHIEVITWEFARCSMEELSEQYGTILLDIVSGNVS